jgi:hypothetical protein
MDHLRGEIGALVKAAPNAEEFAMWRAVFALAHVDGSVVAEEIGFISEAMDVFKFSDEQRAVIYRDMTDRGNVLDLFKAIKDERTRAQFFRLARVLVWCDGFLHEYELAMIEAIKEFLQEDVSRYESELRWMSRKPDLPLGGEGTDDDAVVRHMMVQMIDFYKESGRNAS